MSRYIIELWECVEVEADDKWEAFAKAWELYDEGRVIISECDVVDVMDEKEEA